MFFYKQSSADQVCTNAAGLLTCIILLFGGGQLVCGKSMDRNAYLDLTEMEKEVDAAAVQHAPISTSHFLPWVVSVRVRAAFFLKIRFEICKNFTFRFFSIIFKN